MKTHWKSSRALISRFNHFIMNISKPDNLIKTLAKSFFGPLYVQYIIYLHKYVCVCVCSICDPTLHSFRRFSKNHAPHDIPRVVRDIFIVLFAILCLCACDQIETRTNHTHIRIQTLRRLYNKCSLVIYLPAG